jgi:hypothetical protein
MSIDVLIAITIAPVVFAVLIALGVLVIRGTARRDRWGIGAVVSDCPRCGAGLPPVRVPTSFRQAMWGGWTCPKCELEVDKWGQPLPGQGFPPDDLEDATRPFRPRRPSGPSDDVQPGGGPIRD